MTEEEWDVCNPSWKKNFVCKLNNKGKWRLEQKNKGELIFGKWIFTIEPKNNNNLTPTFADQRNFFTGLFEAEWRNDNFVFNDKSTRPPQRAKKIEMFKEILEEISERAEIKNTPNSVDFYLKKSER